MTYYTSCPLYADINECALGISGCTDVCTNIVGSYYCTCQTGYELTNDNHTCTGQLIIQHYDNTFKNADINECDQNNGKCSQICFNEVGSYVCECQNGYQLDQTGLNCDGK